MFCEFKLLSYYTHMFRFGVIPKSLTSNRINRFKHPRALKQLESLDANLHVRIKPYLRILNSWLGKGIDLGK